jgi:hypothetical protein
MPDVPDDYWLRRAGVFTEEDDDGWIPHDGGACPVAPDTFVQVDLGDVTLDPNRASEFEWHKVQEYRVISSEEFLAGAFGYPLGYDEDDLDTEQPDSPNDHYRQGDIECIDAIRAALTDEEWRGYCKGSIIGYIWRERHKGGDEDLIKSQDFLRWAVAGKAEGKR